MTSLNIYLLFLLGRVGSAMITVFALLGMVAIIYTVCFLAMWFCAAESYSHKDNSDEAITKRRDRLKLGAKKFFKITVPIFICSMVIYIACPTTEQLAIIYLLPKLSNSKLVNTLPAYAQTFLDLEIKKLKKEAVEVGK